MKNENLPEIEPGQHEKLCAYVFGELQGAERAAFEAELLRFPSLRRAKEQLEATVGLVKRAVPDEGLSADVRRELLASARRGRFRLVPGRRMLQLVAAGVVLAGGVLLLRQGGAGHERSPEIRDGARVARVEAPTKLAERELASDARLAKQILPAPAERSAGLEEGLVRFEEAGEPAAARAEPGGDALQLALPTGPTEPTAGQPSAQSEWSLWHEFNAEVVREVGVQELASASTSAPSSPPATALSVGFAGGAGRNENGRLGAREGLVESVNVPLSVGARLTGAYRGPGDARPPSLAVTELERAAASSVRTPEPLRGLGYADALDALGYAGAKAGADEPSTEMRAKLQDLREPARDDDATAVKDLLGRTRPDTAQAPAVAVASREQVAAEVEGILGTCRVGAGESPSAMYFRYFGEAPFVAAREERVSTFAADVDTASYALARAYLNQGQLPPREAVRTEEFVNYFKADQPPPTDGKPFALGLELAPSLFGGDARAEMLRVSVRGKDVADFERQPLALTFVIDNSGSMEQGGRLELVKRALALLLRQLYASDSVAIVKFSNSAAVVTPMIQATRRGELEGLIAGLPIEGGTNVEAGLRLGYEQALQSLQRRGVNRVILCSDGVGNLGETSAKGLLALVEDARKQGIYLNTVGVGMGNLNDAFLEELADKGDGVCNYVDSDAEAKRVFVDGLASALQPIARDVKIQVEFDPARVESWRLLGYENRALRTQDFRNDVIDAGEVNAGHQVSALYELVRRPGSAGPLATARLRYKPPFAIDAGKEGSAARAETEQALELERSIADAHVLPGFAAASNGFQRAALAAQFAEVLRRSVHARADSFATLLSEARRLERGLGDADFTEFVALLERANPLLDARLKEETPKVKGLLDRLASLRFEQARRGRERELAREAGEPTPSEEGRHEVERLEAEASVEIQRLESELRTEIYRARGIEPPALETLEQLRQIGYAK